MNGGYDVSIGSWLTRHREPQPVSRLPDVARQVKQQADEIRKIASDMRRIHETRERKQA